MTEGHCWYTNNSAYNMHIHMLLQVDFLFYHLVRRYLFSYAVMTGTQYGYHIVDHLISFLENEAHFIPVFNLWWYTTQSSFFLSYKPGLSLVHDMSYEPCLTCKRSATSSKSFHNFALSHTRNVTPNLHLNFYGSLMVDNVDMYISS